MRRKIGIGVDRQTAAQFCENHDKFRAVAHNTNRNAEDIYHMVYMIMNDDMGRYIFRLYFGKNFILRRSSEKRYHSEGGRTEKTN